MFARPRRNRWREFSRFRPERGRRFDRQAAPGLPLLNVWVNDDSVVVTAELAGLDPEKVDINVAQDLLTISGRYDDALNDGDAYRRRERSLRRFARTLQLPFAVDAASAEAVSKNGVLEIRLHRPEEEKPRKLPVKAG